MAPSQWCAKHLLDGTAEGSSPQNEEDGEKRAPWRPCTASRAMGAPHIVGLRPQTYPYTSTPPPQNGICIGDAQYNLPDCFQKIEKLNRISEGTVQALGFLKSQVIMTAVGVKTH